MFLDVVKLRVIRQDYPWACVVYVTCYGCPVYVVFTCVEDRGEVSNRWCGCVERGRGNEWVVCDCVVDCRSTDRLGKALEEVWVYGVIWSVIL